LLKIPAPTDGANAVQDADIDAVARAQPRDQGAEAARLTRRPGGRSRAGRSPSPFRSTDMNAMNAPTRMAGMSTGAGAGAEAQKHAEGPVARGIEHYTAQMPSDWFLWAAGASILGSLALRVTGCKEDSQFVGQWAPTLLILGLYNKIVKVAGSDRAHSE